MFLNPAYKVFSRSVVLFCVLAVTACATRPPVSAPAPEATFLAHQASLAALNEWQVTGRIAVRAGEEGWNAHFDWQQQGRDYRIRLRGPFGQGAVELRGNGAGVWLQRADRSVVFALDPEALLLKETGWQLPVSGLGYWLRGLPVPVAAPEIQWDAEGLLRHAEHDGWQIDYTRYQEQGDLSLPDRLRLKRDSLQVKFVIDGWKIS